MIVKWKHGIQIAADRGIVFAIDFPDLVRVEVSADKWAYALVSYAENYIIIQDKAGYPPVYRSYPLDDYPGSLKEFIVAESENPSVPVARDMETIKRLFLKWERIYKTAPWTPVPRTEK